MQGDVAMKYYCTKYWSTQGVIEFNGEPRPKGGYVRERTDGNSWGTLFLRVGKDAFMSLSEAQAAVELKARRNMLSKERALEKAKTLLQQAMGRKIKVVTR